MDRLYVMNGEITVVPSVNARSADRGFVAGDKDTPDDELKTILSEGIVVQCDIENTKIIEGDLCQSMSELDARRTETKGIKASLVIEEDIVFADENVEDAENNSIPLDDQTREEDPGIVSASGGNVVSVSGEQKTLSKSTSGFSGDDEESQGEGSCWSPPSSSVDEYTYTTRVTHTFQTSSPIQSDVVSTRASLGVIEVHKQAVLAVDCGADAESLLNKSESPKNQSSVSFSASSSPNTSNSSADNARTTDSSETSKASSKPSRIPWTTRLIQKITEEENTKKVKKVVVQAPRPKVPPKRSAIYERTEAEKTSPWLQRSYKGSNHGYVPGPLKQAESERKVSKTGRPINFSPREFRKADRIDTTDDSIDSTDSGRQSGGKDRYAELINELVVEPDTVVLHETRLANLEKDKPVKKNSFLNILSKGKSTPHSEPKLSQYSATNTKRSPQSDTSQDISPTRPPVLETAFVSNSPTSETSRDTDQDLMFRKLEAKFSTNKGGFLRQKSLTQDESKPKISPKPELALRSPREGPSSIPKKSPDIYENVNPVYANDVFFRKKRQQGEQSPQSMEPEYGMSKPQNHQSLSRVNSQPSNGYQSFNYNDIQVIRPETAAMKNVTQMDPSPRGYQAYQDNRPRDNRNQYGKIGNQNLRESTESNIPRTFNARTNSTSSPNSVEYRKDIQFEAQRKTDKTQNAEQSFAKETNSKFNEYVQELAEKSNRSSSSSTSTIVSESHWHPDAVDLERSAISGSPEIRKLQQKQRPEYGKLQNVDTNRNIVARNLVYNEEQRIRSQVPLRIQTDNIATDRRYQQVSGRTSAPPGSYNDSYSRRMQSPDPSRSPAPHHSSPKLPSENEIQIQNSPRREGSIQNVPPPRNLSNISVSKSQKYYSLDANQRLGPHSPGQNMSGRLLIPVGAQVRISSAPGEIKRGQAVQNLEANLARNLSSVQKQTHSPSGLPVRVSPRVSEKQQEAIYIERMQRANSLPPQRNPNVDQVNRSFSPSGNYRKLSRQEVEQLYWQTQQIRELKAAQLSPVSAQMYRNQFPSTGSLQSPLNSHSPRGLGEPSVIHNSVPNLKTSPMHGVQNLMKGSPDPNARGVLLKPQPIYTDKNTLDHEKVIIINQQQYIQNMNDMRIRSRSVSPGPNSNFMYANSRSASLPRNSPQNFNMSPNYKPDNVNHFVRGVPQRNTIGPIRSSQPQTLQSTTIYEDAAGVYDSEVELRHPEKLRNGMSPSSKIPHPKSLPSNGGSLSKTKDVKKKDKKPKEKESEKIEPMYAPIFKRGSLVSISNSSVDGATSDSPNIPKRVSFSSGRDSVEQIYWPTRNGLAPEPPTRQHKESDPRPDSYDSDVFLPNSPAGHYTQNGEYLYMNVGGQMPVFEAPDRPLPPIPPSSGVSNYGSIVKQRELNSPMSDVSVRSEGGRVGVRPSQFERPAAQQLVRESPATTTTTLLSPKVASLPNRWQPVSESESGSEAGEVQRILQQGDRRVTYYRFAEEEWGVDGKPRGPPGSDQSASSGGGGGGGGGRGDEEVRRGGGGGRGTRRDEPRRHTLSGDHHQGHHGSLARSMDLEMSSKQRRKSPLPRGYPPPSSAMLFDDDPGIMSEVETSSTGFHRGGKQRSSLPVVRTPSKTLERPLGKGMMVNNHHQQQMHPHHSQMMQQHHHQQQQQHQQQQHQQQLLQHSGGLVFLQYRNETKRALLPNEITSLDTVRALFVRSFPKQLSMEYLDCNMVKIYIHDSSKDMFYELEDLRTHLRDIRDRSVLRLFESADVNGGVLPSAGVGVAPPVWDQDQSYFSEPEFDSEYQHQHIHKSKSSSKSSGGPPYYMTHSYPPGGANAPATLPRGGSSVLRAYSPANPPPLPADRIKSLPQTDRLHSESGYMSSPERGGSRVGYTPGYIPGGSQGAYEDPYYVQYPRAGSITPVIDEEARACLSRIRVEHMERQLANLTGLVQKALTHSPTPREYLQVPNSGRDPNYRSDEVYLRTDAKPPKLGKDKSVSFEKSVSFSDEPPDMNSPKQHSPQHAERTERDTRDRDRHKPAPPPKPVALSPAPYDGRHIYRDLQLTPEMYNQLRGLQKKAKDLRTEVRNLRRMSQAQAHSVRETIRDTFIKIRAMLVSGGADAWANSGDEKGRLSREEDIYKQEMIRLENDLTELEQTVEELRGNVINRKTRVNMSDVENMALILSKSSKTVADLKVRFPGLQEGMKGLLSLEMEKVVREEKFLVEEPERLESALRRCKKLTGTLVTLKRLASVQEQRLPPSTPEARLSPTLGDSDSTPPITPPAHGKAGSVSTRGVLAPGVPGDALSWQRPENALDALLDELQTFARPPSNPSLSEIGRKGSIDSQHPIVQANLPTPQGTLRRLHSYPSSSDGGGNSPPTLSRLQVSSQGDGAKTPAKPPVPERNAELLAQLAGRRVPPPPPPRTSSRSPLASPTSPSLPPRGTPSQPQMGTLRRGAPGRSSLREPLRGNTGLSEAKLGEETNPGFNPLSASNSSSCESVNSQEGVAPKSGSKQRQEVLEQRHQELLRKQQALQAQYARLQQIQRGGAGGLSVPPPDLLQLKKTGSESNLLAKMGLGHSLSAAAPISGSLTHLAVLSGQPITSLSQTPLPMKLQTAPNSSTTTNKVYETDIL